MTLLKSKLLVSVLAAGAFGLGQTGAATTDNLQNLITTGGSLTVGDKTFSNFDFLVSGLTNFDPSQIRVTASVTNGTYYLTWAGNMSLVSGTAPTTADLLLNYTVTAAAGTISAIDNSYTGSAQPAGGAFLSIDESVRDANGNVVANSHLDGNDLSDPAAESGDHLDVNPAQGSLDVTDDIAFGLVESGLISISEIRQSFSQVPEAGTTGLLVLGTAFLGLIVRKNRSRC